MPVWPIEKVIETIKAKSVAQENGCVVWTGNLRDGYGHTRCGGKMRNVHRIIYEFTNGAVPNGFFVCHTCDNRACINLAHLFVGTNYDNILDKMHKGRSGKKLTVKQVAEIKRFLRDKGLTHKEIGRIYGIHQASVTKIALGQRWTHVVID